jgi:predicted signal transduction protein with EAL and GGDEF domain
MLRGSAMTGRHHSGGQANGQWACQPDHDQNPSPTPRLYLMNQEFAPATRVWMAFSDRRVLPDSAARVLGAELRPFDKLFRIGGEEFATILTGTDARTARITADRLRNAIASHPVTIGNGTVQVTISVGVAVAGTGSVPEALVAAADAALYAAKHAGRNQVMVAGEEVS